MLCCERCKAAPERKEGYGDEIDPESASVVRLQEIQTSFGITAVLCIDCRKEWLKWLNDSKTMCDYSEHSFRLEHYRMAHRKRGDMPVEEGVALIRTLNRFDQQLHSEAAEWIASKIITKRNNKHDSIENEDDLNRIFDDDE